MLLRMSNKEDPDQTALFVDTWQATSVQILEYLPNQPLKRQEKMNLKMSSAEVVCFK